jgi:mono/diheme cytochrome c family protein
MKNVCAIVMIALLAGVPFWLWSQQTPNGADLYKTRCAACHGNKGEGTLAGKIPAIKGTAMTVERLVAFLTTGVGGKTVHATPIVNINQDEAKAIAEHVKKLD